MGTGGEGGRVITYVENQKIKNKNAPFRGLGDKGNLLEEISRDFVFDNFNVELVISIVVSIDFIPILTILC